MDSLLKCFRAEYEGVLEYMEFEGEWCRRQIAIYPDAVVLMQEDEVSDAKLSDCEFSPGSEISPDDFGTVWRQMSSLPHYTRMVDRPDIRRYIQGRDQPDQP